MGIRVLDDATIEQIAAGEVIERPSSIVKETVENSIDAGSTIITVEIKDGGISFLRVTDNGSGIDGAEVKTAFLRHATSKLSSADDLVAIKSLGFRGEALASIAAVGRVEIITKTRDAMTGVRFLTEGSKEVSLEEIGAPDGTTIIVRDLFFNTPVRARFLKSPQTEGGYIGDVMERLAMSHPEISFTFITNGKTKLHTSGNGKRKDVIYAIYGKEIASRLIEIDDELDGIRVKGFISVPQITRVNRNYESYFINGRYMKSELIAKAIDEAYKPYIMGHMFPFTALEIDMDEVMVDVNVHPTKMEVRFSNSKILFDALVQIIGKALSNRNLVPEVVPGKGSLEKKAIIPETKRVEPFEANKLREIREYVAKDSPYSVQYGERASARLNAIIESSVSENSYKENAGVADIINDNSVIADTVSDKLDNIASTESDKMDSSAVITDYHQQSFEDLMEMPLTHNIKVLGQLFKTYWIIEDLQTEKMYIVDQHAAHEKVNFERKMEQFRNRSFYSQQLAIPMVVSLTNQQKAAFELNVDEFTDLGFEVEDFGDNEIKITAVPDNVYGVDPQELFIEVLDDLTTGNKSTNETLWLKVATASCKASIKGNTVISELEIRNLIEELLTLDNPYNCPHGRPTMIAMTKAELEKKFRRIV